MSTENEDEVNEQQEVAAELAPKVSRARNRTVMLTPELTGQVRNAIKEEIKEEPSDFARPGQKIEAEKPQATNPAADSLQQSNIGLKFGKSVNRSRTTKLSRDEVDKAVKDNTNRQEESYVLPTPVVPKAFDPLTSIAPPNHGLSHGQNRGPDLGSPRQAPRVENRQAPLLQQSPPLIPQQNMPMQQPQAMMPQPLLQQSQPQVKSQPLKGLTKIVGFLISFDQDQNGEVFEIRAGRKLITSRPTDHGEFLLIEHESISPLHAILRTTKEGRLQVLDQLSEHGTGITREGESEEIEVAGGLELVQNGDTLRFGERRFLVCLVTIK